MQNIFRRNRFRANPRFGKGHILGNVRIQMMADHQHIQMLAQRINRERHRRIRRGGQAVRLAAHFDNVRRMAAARAFRMVGMDRAAFESVDRILHEARFVQRVGVDRDLHVIGLGHCERTIDRRRRRPPILMQFQPDRACFDLLAQRHRFRAIALAEKTKIDRQPFCRL